MANTDEQPLEIQAAKRSFRKWLIGSLITVVTVMGGWLVTIIQGVIDDQKEVDQRILERMDDVRDRVISLERENSSWEALAEQERRLRELEALALAHDRIGKVLLHLGVADRMEELKKKGEAAERPKVSPPKRAPEIDPAKLRKKYEQRGPARRGGK